MWPTPDASVMQDGETPETFEARRERVKLTAKNGNGMGTPLAMAAQMWPTPAARDYKGANGEGHLENSTGSLHLDQLPNFVAHMWATPRVEMARALGNPKHITPERGNGNLEDHTSAFSLPAPETPPDGRPSSPSDPTSRRQLNPAFVEWLMGWPEGWTAFASWAMAWSRWRQRTRSALLALDTPPPAMPEQMSLFG